MNQFNADRHEALVVMAAAERSGYKDLRWTGKDELGMIVSGRMLCGKRLYQRVRLCGVDTIEANKSLWWGEQ